MAATEQTVYHTPQEKGEPHVRIETVFDDNKSVSSTPGDTLRLFGQELSHRTLAASSPASVYSHNRVLELKSHRVASGLSEASQASVAEQHGERHRLAMAELEDRIQDQEEELAKAQSTIQDAKVLEESRKKEIKSLAGALAEANDSIRSLKVELDALGVRHAESVRLSETYIADARLSRDEEVARLEQQIAEVRRAGEERMDAAKTITAELRQENEMLKSQMKKMEQVKRDAERETQRAVNRFEAAVQSLEQLEHQYALLEKDAKETEAVKMERILSLEQEVEDLRMAKVQTSKQLEQQSDALKDAEQCRRRAEEAREEALTERGKAQAKVERLESVVEKLTSENQALVASQARLQGTSDGAAEVSRSMQAMLETYEKEHVALMADLNDTRGRIAVMEGRRHEEREEVDAFRSRACKAERLLEEQVREATKREEELKMRLEAHERTYDAQKVAWKAEREKLTRELELAMGQLSVAQQQGVARAERADVERAFEKTTVDPVQSAQTPQTQTFYSVDDEQSAGVNMSVSIGTEGIAENSETTLGTPGTVTSGRGTSSNINSKEELKAQLTALKLSLLSDNHSTPGLSKTSQARRTMTGAPPSGYLQAHRPHVIPTMSMDIEDDATASTCSEEDDEHDVSLEDQLAGARNSIAKAKTVLRRITRV